FFAVIFPIHPTIESTLYFLFLSFILTGLVLAVNFFTGIITVRFRDLQHISQIAMQILFYATPIFYQLSIVPENLRPYFELNPLYQLIDAGRHALISGEIVRVQEVLLVFIFTIVLLIAGYMFFQRNVKRVAEFF
ncbi:MAG: ABC transporter permease, partial [Ignavibacteriae bacterium]|nr:ABC transporter permease [Ignavibacteriota bacterium]